MEVNEMVDVVVGYDQENRYDADIAGGEGFVHITGGNPFEYLGIDKYCAIKRGVSGE
jgi:hypothetical protein